MSQRSYTNHTILQVDISCVRVKDCYEYLLEKDFSKMGAQSAVSDFSFPFCKGDYVLLPSSLASTLDHRTGSITSAYKRCLF